jgi:hypothetical protein
MFFRLKLPPGLGGAFWIAVLVLLTAELALHSEPVLHRYRSVFAVGRAIDKLDYVETHVPHVLFIGNSRVDNGVDPHTFSLALGQPASSSFNLGLPGANVIVYQGLVARLDAQGLLGSQGIRTVVLGLDESALQEDNSLGYVGFLADRGALWASGRYLDWFGNMLRLWSYSANLRQLREPEKLLRFVEATSKNIEPVGGGAAEHLGYRAGFGAAQNQDQTAIQEAAAHQPPAAGTEYFLWRAIDRLQARGVAVVVTVPPLRDRPSAFFSPDAHARPYRALRVRLEQRGVTVLPEAAGYTASDFINAGHLNDSGAQRYSTLLGRQLAVSGER